MLVRLILEVESWACSFDSYCPVALHGRCASFFPHQIMCVRPYHCSNTDGCLRPIHFSLRETANSQTSLECRPRMVGPFRSTRLRPVGQAGSSPALKKWWPNERLTFPASITTAPGRRWSQKGIVSAPQHTKSQASRVCSYLGRGVGGHNKTPQVKSVQITGPRKSLCRKTANPQGSWKNNTFFTSRLFNA